MSASLAAANEFPIADIVATGIFVSKEELKTEQNKNYNKQKTAHCSVKNTFGGFILILFSV